MGISSATKLGDLAGQVDRLNAALDACRAELDSVTARERLRLADDLHDLLGHALEVVAFKAELADRLLGSRQPRVRAEMVEIQRVARAAIVDVRAMAHGRRRTDLAAELASSAAILESAGIEVFTSGDPASIAVCAQDPLGRALHEATTNVLRHSRPTYCEIRLEQVAWRAGLTVTNDGADPCPPGAQAGSGLAGLARQLGERAGCLTSELRAGCVFVLQATVALSEPVVGPETRVEQRAEGELGGQSRSGGLQLLGRR